MSPEKTRLISINLPNVHQFFIINMEYYVAGAINGFVLYDKQLEKSISYEIFCFLNTDIQYII